METTRDITDQKAAKILADNKPELVAKTLAEVNPDTMAKTLANANPDTMAKTLANANPDALLAQAAKMLGLSIEELKKMQKDNGPSRS